VDSCFHSAKGGFCDGDGSYVEGDVLYVYNTTSRSWRKGKVDGVSGNGTLWFLYDDGEQDAFSADERDLSRTPQSGAPDHWAGFAQATAGDPIIDTLVAEHNRVRRNPAAYASELKTAGSQQSETDDGFDFFTDALAYLKGCQPTDYPLQYSADLARIAQEHAEYLASPEFSGGDVHTGRGGTQIWDRIGKEYSFTAGVAESVATWSDAARLVRDLTVDVGNRNPDAKFHCLHRQYIYDKQNTMLLRTIGVGHAPHHQGGTTIVINYTGTLKPKA
jgi:hypothetical protein